MDQPGDDERLRDIKMKIIEGAAELQEHKRVALMACNNTAAMQDVLTYGIIEQRYSQKEIEANKVEEEFQQGYATGTIDAQTTAVEKRRRYLAIPSHSGKMKPAEGEDQRAEIFI